MTTALLDDLVWSDARSQATAIREGSISVLDLTNAFLDRIERFNDTLRSYVTVGAARARATATRCDEMLSTIAPERLPPFHGVTMSVKDVVDVEGCRQLTRARYSPTTSRLATTL